MATNLINDRTRVESFAYADGPDPAPACWDAWGGLHLDIESPGAGAEPPSFTLPPVEWEKMIADEARRNFDAGRERGRAEGKAEERQAQAAESAGARTEHAVQAARLVQTFAEERERYLREVEPDVVRLALAVAARILRRESQMDPLLLTGAVRVALGQLAASTQVRLRVPEAEVELWREAIALLPNLPVRPEVLNGDEMRLGDCIVETAMGSVDLGIRAQLSEIERGFFDRSAPPPQARDAQPNYARIDPNRRSPDPVHEERAKP